MSERKPIIVLASGNGSTFESIVLNCKVAEVTMLLSDQPGAFALERAKSLGVPTFTIIDNKTSEEIHQQFRSLIPALQPRAELIVLAGYMRILPPEFVREFPRILNIHPSLLPKYKGLDTYKRVLASGEMIHGTTVHQVTEELDDGPVVAQESVPILEGDTVDTLKERTQEVERRLYPKIIDKIVTREIGWMGEGRP